MCKQISVFEKNTSDATDAIIQICLDPRKGLTDECLEIAKAQDGSGFFESWFGVSTQSVMLGTVVVGAAAAASIQFYRKHKIKV